MVVQANPANFPKVYSPDENTMNFNHSLFGNKGNGGFPNPYAEMVKGYKDRFSNTTLAQFSVEQNLDAITEGLRLRGMASVRTFLSNENQRSFTPFYYGLSEIQTDEGIDYSLYQIQEGRNILMNHRYQIMVIVIFIMSSLLNITESLMKNMNLVDYW